MSYPSRFEIGSFAFQNSYLDYKKDDEDGILISSNLMVKRLEECNASSSVDTEDNKIYDVYRDPNVFEVVKLAPVLSAMRKRISALLAEFEEQPALVRVKKRNTTLSK